MPVRGHIENGAVVLDEPTDLPEGAKVVVELDPHEAERELSPEIKRVTGILPPNVDIDAALYQAIMDEGQ